MGACLCCPKCSNYFTVAPSSLVPEKPPQRPAGPAPRVAAVSAPPTPPAEQPWWVTTPPQTAVTPTPEPPPLPTPRDSLPAPLLNVPRVPPPPTASPLPEWANGWGIVGFFLAALVMLFAALTFPRWLAMCFAGLGLVLGLIGLAVPPSEWKLKDGLWLALGGGGCGLLLLLGLVCPSWLSDRWAMSFVVRPTESAKPMRVSLSKAAESQELGDDERADATLYAIRHGDLLIRIERAEIQKLPNKDLPLLLIALHVENVGQLHILTYHGQGSAEHSAVVRDSRGKELPRCDLGAQAEKRGQVPMVTVLPLHATSDLIAVEAPWPGTEHVQVDMPASAWGREGVCRFTIPSKLLRR